MTFRNWTKDELILAINLYCKIPFGKMHRGNPDIIDLAKLINRTPSAVSWKLVNFASLDPSLQQRGIRGAVNRSKLDEEIWSQFFNDWETLSYESEKLLAKYRGKKLEESASILLNGLPKEGKEKERVTRIRVNQYFFRLTVLAAYNFRCCITGLPVPDLLVASHIVPWAQDKSNRLNPRNGLCLNALHDKAFDKGLIAISNDHKIILSKKIKSILRDNATMLFFKKFENNIILMPNRFLPDSDFLDFHRQHIFQG
jgi:putative restriction endonuclease